MFLSFTHFDPMFSWSISKEIHVLLNLAIYLKVKIETRPVLKKGKKIQQMDPQFEFVSTTGGPMDPHVSDSRFITS